MAAALRFTARRLGGGQWSQAVYKVVRSPLVEEEQRRLLPRLIHGGRPLPLRSMSSSSSGGAAAHRPNGNTALKQSCSKPEPELDAERQWAYHQITEIETKKHELFYLLADMHKRYPGRRYSKINKELLQNLFGHVERNPSDPLWLQCRGTERINNCVFYGMPTLLAIWMYLDWDAWRDMFADFLGVNR